MATVSIYTKEESAWNNILCSDLFHHVYQQVTCELKMLYGISSEKTCTLSLHYTNIFKNMYQLIYQWSWMVIQVIWFQLIIFGMVSHEVLLKWNCHTNDIPHSIRVSSSWWSHKHRGIAHVGRISCWNSNFIVNYAVVFWLLQNMVIRGFNFPRVMTFITTRVTWI